MSDFGRTNPEEQRGSLICTLAPGLRVLDAFVQEKVRHSCLSRNLSAKTNNEAKTEFSLISLTSGCGRAKPTTSFMWYSSRILLEPSIGDASLCAIAVYFTDPSWPLKELKEACLYKYLGQSQLMRRQGRAGRSGFPLGKFRFLFYVFVIRQTIKSQSISIHHMKKLNIYISYQIYSSRTSTVGYDVPGFPGHIMEASALEMPPPCQWLR